MQIRFSFETVYGTYSDCLNLPDDHQLTDAEIDDIKTQRRDSWIAFMDSAQNAMIEETAPPSNPVINVDIDTGV